MSRMSKKARKEYCTLDFKAVDDSVVFHNSVVMPHFFTINQTNHIEPVIYRASWSTMANKDKSENRLIKRHKQFTRMVTKSLSMKNRQAIDENGKILNIDKFIELIRPKVLSETESIELEKKYKNLRNTFYDNAQNTDKYQHFIKLSPSATMASFVDDYIKWRESEDKKITLKDSEAGELIDFHDIEQSLLPGFDLPLSDTDSMPELLSDSINEDVDENAIDPAYLTTIFDEYYDESLDPGLNIDITLEHFATASSDAKSTKRKRDSDGSTTSNEDIDSEDTTLHSTPTKKKKGKNKLR